MSEATKHIQHTPGHRAAAAIIDGPAILDVLCGAASTNPSERQKAIDYLAETINAHVGSALDGIPDPAKFVEVFGQMREALNKSERELNHVVNVMNRKGGMYEDALVSVRQALAAAKEVANG